MMEKFRGFMKMERKRWFSLMVLRGKSGLMGTLLCTLTIMILNKLFQMEKLFTFFLMLRLLRQHSQTGYKCLSLLITRLRSILLMELKKSVFLMELLSAYFQMERRRVSSQMVLFKRLKNQESKLLNFLVVKE